MSREEAVVEVFQEYSSEWNNSEEAASDVLAAADAHDAAHGIHRLAVDDATVERAAWALDPKAWDEEAIMFIAHGQSPEDARASRQNYARADARRVLAAAVEAGQ